MTFRGTVKKGVIVFSKAPPPLPDGTVVRVEPVTTKKKQVRSKSKQPLQPVGRWQGGAEEIDRLLDEVQRLRDADLSLEREAWR